MVPMLPQEQFALKLGLTQITNMFRQKLHAGMLFRYLLNFHLYVINTWSKACSLAKKCVGKIAYLWSDIPQIKFRNYEVR
jgi:hypothetical protein